MKKPRVPKCFVCGRSEAEHPPCEEFTTVAIHGAKNLTEEDMEALRAVVVAARRKHPVPVERPAVNYEEDPRFVSQRARAKPVPSESLGRYLTADEVTEGLRLAMPEPLNTRRARGSTYYAGTVVRLYGQHGQIMEVKHDAHPYAVATHCGVKEYAAVCRHLRVSRPSPKGAGRRGR